MLVLGIIGSRTLARGRIDGMTYNDFMSLARPNDEPAPINLQSIADYSGIPRETVRRKIRDLEQSGWIIRRDNSFLIASSKCARDLAPRHRGDPDLPGIRQDRLRRGDVGLSAAPTSFVRRRKSLPFRAASPKTLDLRLDRLRPLWVPGC
ncbi:helix-turn-helix domain-containing protein [Halochromatium glycolicum]|uniref:HTH crp-type domain-containing protein n=1 Tax=Halochromatium glycolicum TaxID=85075 RepID=A0AAJ0U6Y7_9GAMM|nr:helix-turn-helix domain-containing protein [Halochromatium glycolicum]MBK1706454.1 hypothetical protein [Halochromatium glycolicum]